MESGQSRVERVPLRHMNAASREAHHLECFPLLGSSRVPRYIPPRIQLIITINSAYCILLMSLLTVTLQYPQAIILPHTSIKEYGIDFFDHIVVRFAILLHTRFRCMTCHFLSRSSYVLILHSPFFCLRIIAVYFTIRNKIKHAFLYIVGEK